MNKKVSFENTKRLLERGAKVNSMINDLILRDICKSKKEAVHLVNKAVFDMAEENGVSIWDICFRFVPRWGLTNPSFTPGEYKVESTIDLIQLELEFEKGPGYWKDKYYRLKEKMQELINDKNDGEED